jgi:hypothetical protein
VKNFFVWSGIAVAIITLSVIFVMFRIVATALEAVLWVVGLGILFGFIAYLMGRRTATLRK